MKLVQYNQTHLELIENYRLSESQLRYTSLPLDAVAVEDPLRTHILAMQSDQFVTFFTLDRGEDAHKFSENNLSILIRSFSTDFHQQGKGYARKALQLLPAYIKNYFTDVNEIVLAVNIKNHAAQGLYTACGFSDTNKRFEGSKGTLILMNHSLHEIKQLI